MSDVEVQHASCDDTSSGAIPDINFQALLVRLQNQVLVNDGLLLHYDAEVKDLRPWLW